MRSQLMLRFGCRRIDNSSRRAIGAGRPHAHEIVHRHQQCIADRLVEPFVLCAGAAENPVERFVIDGVMFHACWLRRDVTLAVSNRAEAYTASTAFTSGT